MLTALIGLGLLFLVVGFACLVRPNAIQRWTASMKPMPRYVMAVGIRAGFGFFLLAVAPEARWPGPTRVFGYFALFAATAVVPLPANGSNTRSPFFELARMIFARSFSGFCVG